MWYRHQPPLSVNALNRLFHRQAARDFFLNEVPDDISLSSRDFLTDNHWKRRTLPHFKRPPNGIVVGNRDPIQTTPLYSGNNGLVGAQAIRRVKGVHVQVEFHGSSCVRLSLLTGMISQCIIFAF